MDPREFDRLVARIFAERDRRAAVKGLLGGAAAAVGLPALAEAKNKKGKHDKNKQKGKDDNKNKSQAQDEAKADKNKAKAEGNGQKGKRQVGAEKHRKKNFCQCQGTSQEQCTSTTCVNCTYFEQIGRGKRRTIKRQFRFSFKVKDASQCPGTTTTPTPPTTSTTAAPNTTTTTTPLVCNGQACISGAADQCGRFGANCVCISSGVPGSTGFCGRPTTTTTTSTSTTTTTPAVTTTTAVVTTTTTAVVTTSTTPAVTTTTGSIG